jgi:hypothetical protein
MYLFVLITSALYALVVPSIAYAQLGVLDGLVSGIGANAGFTTLLTFSPITCPSAAGAGACGLANMMVYAVVRGRVLISAIALIIMVVAGFRLVISQSDEALGTARNTIVGVVTGLFLIYLAEPFIDSIYGGFTLTPGGMSSAGVMLMSNELLGVLQWGETFVASLAIGLLVYQAVMAFGSFGSEEVIRKTYRAVMYTALGLILIGFKYALAAVFGYTSIGTLPGDPDALVFLAEFFGIVRFILGFVAFIVVGIIIYAGFMMIASFGHEEGINKGKGMLINAIIGLVLISLSFTIVSTVILGV